MKTHLFFDDQWLIGRDNLVRKYGKPELIKDSVYKDPNVNTPVCFTKVFFDKALGKYIMFYNGFDKNRKTCVFTAQSDDAIHWEPRNIAAEAGVENPMAPNQCFSAKYSNEVVSMIYNENGPQDEKYIILGSNCLYQEEKRCVCKILTSADGIKWKLTERIWHNTLMGCEPLGGVFYNELNDNFVINSRPCWGDRRVCIVETKDFIEFTEPELVLQADSLDEPLMDIQGMSAYPYKGYYIGFIYPYHVAAEPKDKAIFGKVDCQLAYSLNGRAFQRSLRTPFIGNGEPNDPTYGMVWPDNMRIGENGEIYITATASTIEHGFFEQYGTGSIVTYKLRNDGFVFLEADGGVGRLCTRCMYYEGGGFGINIEAPNGFATCALYDDDVVHPFRAPIEGFSHEDSIAFSGDSTYWTPKFKSRDIEEMKDKIFMLEIKLTGGRLYSISGNFKNMMATEVFRYNSFGEIPTRKGF